MFRTWYLIITDEIYKHLVYEDAESLHILSILPQLADQTIVVNGVAKTYAMTGYIGWMIYLVRCY